MMQLRLTLFYIVIIIVVALHLPFLLQQRLPAQKLTIRVNETLKKPPVI